MTTEHVLGFLLALIAICFGVAIGEVLAIRSLLIGVERDDRTPHKLGNNFYYIVPESEYCEMRCKLSKNYGWEEEKHDQ